MEGISGKISGANIKRVVDRANTLSTEWNGFFQYVTDYKMNRVKTIDCLIVIALLTGIRS